jgi:hypothetical protein
MDWLLRVATGASQPWMRRKRINLLESVLVNAVPVTWRSPTLLRLMPVTTFRFWLGQCMLSDDSADCIELECSCSGHGRFSYPASQGQSR